MYLLYGLNEYLIKQKIDEILNMHQLNKIDITNYDLEKDLLSDIITDANTLSLFSNTKGLIIHNANIFVGTKNICDTTCLENYLANQNESSILIFVVNTSKLNQQKKIIKLLLKYGQVFELDEKNLIPIVKKMFNNYNIDTNTLSYFINRVGNDLFLLNNEAIKLMLYKDDNTITTTDIDLLTIKNIEGDLFKLIEAIINKDKELAISIYHKMLEMKEEPIAIVISLANQIRIMFQTKVLYQLGHTENEMAEILDIHPYRVKKAREKNIMYSNKTLLTYLSKLADLDLNIKKGLIDKDLVVETFILQL